MSNGEKKSQIHNGSGDNVGGDKIVYNFGHTDNDTVLAIAVLIGSWDESKSGDISFIESVTNEPYSDWIIKIRQIESNKNSSLKHDSKKWVVDNRVETWKHVASRLFDDHLDRFKAASIIIFSSINPSLNLDKENRWVAPLYGKVYSHSQLIRVGVSEGLALMSNASEFLTNCSSGYGQYTASIVVKDVLNTSNWMLWASTKDMQPILAEAAPKEFLGAVEAAVIHDDKPFSVLFSQESISIAGQNYMTGLLWALEKLAWLPDYITRCVVLLGELDSHDPGGRWRNRPSNSITDILLPWKPHTTANYERRFAAIKALEREFPESAWKVLLQLLPNSHQYTSGTCKPSWIKSIPADYKQSVSHKEYYEQITQYSNYAVELSKKDNSRLQDLIENLDLLHDDAFNASVELLLAYSQSNKRDNDKSAVWSKLLSFINKHKKFSDANWSLSKEKLAKLESVKKCLQPQDKQLLYRRYFNNRNIDLYEQKGSWCEQEEKLNELRKKIISEFFFEGGHRLVYEFAKSVEYTALVGNALASIPHKIDEDLLLKYLQSDDVKTNQFMAGYIWNINYLTDGQFIEDLNFQYWDKDDATKLFFLLPFNSKTWVVVDLILGEKNEHLYWLKVSVNAYHTDDVDSLYVAIEKLLKYHRPLSCLHCIYYLLHSKKSLRIEPTIRALLDAVNTNESSSSIDSYEIGEIINYIQNSDQVSDDDRLMIEWAYLPLIKNNDDESGSCEYLEKRLSKDPEFFCEIISIAESDIINSETASNKQQLHFIDNANSLLNEWKRVPGVPDDGTFDFDLFKEWFKNVSEIAQDISHYHAALRAVGKVLTHSPKSNDGLWIELKLAEFLNERGLDEVRNAYKCAVFNSRGVHWVDPEAKAEIKLSEQYLAKSEEIDLRGLQRFSCTLKEIAEYYSAEAQAIVKRYSQPSGRISD